LVFEPLVLDRLPRLGDQRFLAVDNGFDDRLLGARAQDHVHAGRQQERDQLFVIALRPQPFQEALLAILLGLVGHLQHTARALPAMREGIDDQDVDPLEKSWTYTADFVANTPGARTSAQTPTKDSPDRDHPTLLARWNGRRS